MTSHFDKLSAYLPHIVRDVAARHGQPQGADLRELHGAVLLADISGFTVIAEELAKLGVAGAEELAKFVNAFFGRLTDLIETHGGDVIRLAGDAVLAFWRSELDEVPAAAWHAARCALAVQQGLTAEPAALPGEVAVRIGIGAGDAALLRAGGLDGSFHAALCGRAIADASMVQQHASAGEIALTDHAWRMISNLAVGVPLPTGSVRLLHLADKEYVAPRLAARSTDGEVPDREVVAGYVPRGVLGRLDGGHGEWQAELRRVSVLFVNLLDVDTARQDFLVSIQGCVATAQSLAERYEAVLTELVFDDKGTTLIIVLGLPPMAHEDDASRAIDIAMELLARLTAQGVRAGIGITTGTVFAGSVGNASRREYKIVGDIVNLAARLMKVSPGEAVCDPATHRVAQSRFAFAAMAPISVKGRRGELEVFRPLHRELRSTRSGPLLGRRAERSRLSARLDELLAGHGGVTIIEGEPGIGKSRLVADLVDMARSRGVRALVGRGDPVEQRTPYLAWRAPFTAVLDLEGDASGGAAERREHVLARLKAAGIGTDYASLLNSVLPLDLPDTDITLQMTGVARSDTTHELLAEILRCMGGERNACTMLVIEDAHWLDSASWALARFLEQRLAGVLLVVSTRPMTEPLPPVYARLLESASLLHVKLDGLSAEEIEQLLCHRFLAERISPRVLDVVQRRAQGNPFFSEELGYALRDAGMIEVGGGLCDFATPAAQGESIELPLTVHGVVTARIDRLSSQQQLTLKVASVIGRIFACRILRDIYPVPAHRPQIEVALALLERINITQIETPEPDRAYLFRHAITHEVAYGLMTFAQRRQLHRTVADWYERAGADDLSPVYALLAFHWRRAEDRSKSIDYLEKAGEQALHNSALKEAIAFFDDAIALAGQEGGAVPAVRLARWERQLGDAHLGLGHLPESRAHFERVLTLLGWSVPRGRARWGVQVVAEIVRQLAHRLWPSRFVGRAGTNDAAYLEASRARGRLAELYFYAHEKLPMLHAVVSTLNLAEAVGPSPELARAYGSFSYAVGSVPLHGLAERYGRMARDTAVAIDDLPARLWAFEVTGFYDIGIANWNRGRRSLEHAMAISERLGDRRRRDECLGLLLVATHYQGEIRRALDMSLDVYVSSSRREDAQFQIVGLIGQSENLLVLGRTCEVQPLLQEALDLLGKAPDFTQEMKAYALLALAHLRLGDPSEALREARKGVELIKRRLPMATHGLWAYVGPAEVMLHLWEAGQSRYRVPAKRACAALEKFAGVFPIGKPRALLMRGRHQWRDGAGARALKSWRASLHEARRLGMAYDEGLAHATLAVRLKADHPERSAHAAAATEIFNRIGAAHDLEQLRA